jgi:hypothetical protein
MGTEPSRQHRRLPLAFDNLPLGSLYEDRLVEDLLLLAEVVSACMSDDDARLAELGVVAPAPTLTALSD